MPNNKAAELKVKAAQFKAAKEKEHPPPPPAQVLEPPTPSNPKGSVYQVGKLLGKGGFAICYYGLLEGTKQRYALKIVKSKMPPKMEQKVCLAMVLSSVSVVNNLLILDPCRRVSVSNRAANTLQDEAQEYRQLPPRI